MNNKIKKFLKINLFIVASLNAQHKRQPSDASAASAPIVATRKFISAPIERTFLPLTNIQHPYHITPAIKEKLRTCYTDLRLTEEDIEKIKIKTLLESFEIKEGFKPIIADQIIEKLLQEIRTDLRLTEEDIEKIKIKTLLESFEIKEGFKPIIANQIIEELLQEKRSEKVLDGLIPQKKKSSCCSILSRCLKCFKQKKD